MSIKKTQDDERAFFLQEAAPSSSSGGNKRNTPQNPNAGHRERLRERFNQAGSDSVADYELLELLLFRSLPRRDTKPIAKELITKFGSFGDVLSADPERLMEVKGVKDATAFDLKLIAAAGRMMGKGSVVKKEVLSSWAAVLEYCTAAMAYETREQFRILFLDKRNKLIADEVQQIGTVDHTPVYPREVTHKALKHSATAIILVHNHPSGDPTPSEADIKMTELIIDVLEPLNIAVHDHIIIGKDGHASLKGMGLI